MDRKISCRAAFGGVCKTIKKKRQDNYFNDYNLSILEKSAQQLKNGDYVIISIDEIRAMANGD